jgi:hypothetical protein
VQDLVQVEMPDGAVIFALVRDSGPGDVAFDKVPRALVGLTETIRGVAGNVRRGLHELSPEEVTVEFGVELAASPGGVVAALAGVHGNASIKVTLGWKSGGAETAER